LKRKEFRLVLLKAKWLLVLGSRWFSFYFCFYTKAQRRKFKFVVEYKINNIRFYSFSERAGVTFYNSIVVQIASSFCNMLWWPIRIFLNSSGQAIEAII
jgi:hypothetical protein